ncbi:TonB-dependent receptor [Portibacter lacus]|uniref:Collagen-binding protein n=1 Tax=Portibacter lacus TaxID=1099794 RepID=A0AA37SV58_9BACT|nr:TonB-dependent receptor [Portibacter lacus]GLR19750.1 collagen-binding protein [Portibacter lacus]
MVRKVLFILLGITLSTIVTAQSLISIVGDVSDLKSTEKLIGASIYTPDFRYHTSSNEFGAFQINVPDTCTYLLASYIGFKQDTLEINSTLHFLLEAENYLDSIFIQAPIIRQKQEVSGKISMPISIAEKLPQLFGSTDIMKSLALYPGIQSGVEGTSGLFIRGGGPGQNLILLDENKVYNNSHLYGFSSVFNPNVVKSVDLYKSGFPAQYGSRVSSILSINTIDGNSKKQETKITAGILESGISTHGPIKNLNATYVFAGRVFYLSAFTLPSLIRYNIGKNNSYRNYFFYDINGKVKFKIGKKQSVSLSYFQGDDNFSLRDRSSNEYSYESAVNWGSELMNIRYTNHVSKNHFVNFNILRNQYLYQLRNSTLSGIDIGEFKNLSKIVEYEINLKAEFRPNNNLKIEYGFNITNPRYSPFEIDTKINFADTSKTLSKKNSSTFYQQGYYVDMNIALPSNFTANIGARVDNYNVPSETKLYYSPRLKIQYYNKSHKFSFTYDKASQFEHLLSGNNGGVPSDIFIPSLEISPQLSDQYAIGYFKNFKKHNLSLNGDLFFRSLKNQILYLPDFYDLYLANSSFVDNLIKDGVGKVYGFEFFLRQEKTRFQYSFSYTFLYNTRVFPGFNEGKAFNSAFSRKHDLQLNFNYILKEKLNLNINFIYSSGHYITLPNTSYIDQNGYPTAIIDEWNGVKTRDYNRADIAIIYKYKKKKREVKWKFGIYNLYAYQNPMFYEYTFIGTFRNENGVSKPVESQSVIYGQSNFILIPSISYETKF